MYHRLKTAASVQSKRSFWYLRSWVLTCDSAARSKYLSLLPRLVCAITRLWWGRCYHASPGHEGTHPCPLMCGLLSAGATNKRAYRGCSLSEFAIKVGIFTDRSLQITIRKSLTWPLSCIMWVRAWTTSLFKHVKAWRWIQYKGEREIAGVLHPLYLSAGDAHLCGVINCPLEVYVALNVMLWFGQVWPLVNRCSPQWNYCLSRAYPRISKLISTSFDCYSKKVIPSATVIVCGQIQMGQHIKMLKLSNALILCESLGDQAWMLLFDLQRHPWVGAVLNLTSQNWHLDECWVYCKWNKRRLYLNTFS